MANKENLSLGNMVSSIKRWVELHGYSGLSINTIIINKICYYTAKDLNCNIVTGWYKYGPCIQQFADYEMDPSKMYDMVKPTKEVDPTIEGYCNKLFPKYRDDRFRNRGNFDFLDYVYKEMNPHQEIRNYYIAKNSLLRSISLNLHSDKKNSLNDVLDAVSKFNYHSMEKSFVEFTKLDEDMVDLTIKYTLMYYGLLDRLSNATSQEYERLERAAKEGERLFILDILTAPACKDFIATMYPRDTDLIKQYENQFKISKMNTQRDFSILRSLITM